ncbi:hypothetical protein SODALDRAFT_376305 [Sodiomyces alkalinus F11]|uniref:Ubiquitin-like protein smt3 n=1 Tax=Sodiomyces alkalinus (strain CBS 110278 / VKM F-3762 / F11) TaxID=1314773 RepID=A0A3N2Q1E9_SODAK|nr:hypothetical protein SODALDRAFT_376305 [Sodiomyces alkalinus F11]ROT40518.1 hypothetical protein SODALDRAFT_376305 [Sodiomyces alkalinus F11]
MASPDQSSEVTSTLSKLTIKPSKKSGKGAKASEPKEPVLDSWEDQEIDSDVNSDSGAGAGVGSGADNTPVPRDGDEGSKAPPPTPISPSKVPSTQPWIPPLVPPSPGTNDASHAPTERRRPEKTDATARRMIASALGVKVPRMTEEQRAYDRAVKERERKRREQEKAAEAKKREEAEKAKAAIWDD